MRKVMLLVLLIVSITLIKAQDFTEVAAGLPGVSYSSTAWGDYDNDGDLDILLTGNNYDGSTYSSISKIYRNDSGVFTDINAGSTGVDFSSVAWGDYDNDGDLDLLLTGYTGDSSNQYIANIYRNDSGIFTDINAGLIGVRFSSVAWGDYDNDGDLDILITGNSYSSGYISKIYRNDSGMFTDINAGLTGVSNCSAAWGDYDNDGDLDIITGNYIYKNDSGVFTNVNAGLLGVNKAAWGDYDSDGDLDLLLTGNITSSVRYSKIYKNESGVFTDINAGLTGINSSSVAWGDYDNDGDLDILQAGYTGTGQISKIYRNDSGIFTDINAGLTGVYNCSVAWGDYDNDGDLDIMLTGLSSSGGVSKLYRNNCVTENTKPNTPTGLEESLNGDTINFTWNKATDTETPQNGLCYNLYVRSDSLYIKSSMSDIITGYRKIVSIDNTNETNSWAIKNLPSGDYYWSVQSVDNAFAGSEFAVERTFSYNTNVPFPPVAVSATNLGTYSFTANWNSTEWAMGYYLDVATDISFTNYAAGYQNKDVADILTLNVTGLSADTIYYYRVRAYNSERETSGNSNVISVKTYILHFTDMNAALTGVSSSSTAWGDYDNDGDLDILLTGYTGDGEISKIYLNYASGSYTGINAGLTGVDNSSVEWGDYDNDGDLDILLTGSFYVPLFLDNVVLSKIYRNDFGVFTDINAGLAGVHRGSSSWGDYDNDGDLDILLTGEFYNGSVLYNVSKIYRNDSGVFTDINAGLIGVRSSSVEWGDYDNDGDLDILLTGYTGTENISKIYRNDSGIFTDINASLITNIRSAKLGDYDNDGDLDILLIGPVSKIYRNDSGVFTDINAGLPGVIQSSVAWGDYDNDGDPDILLTGDTGSGFISKIYRNDSGVFTDINAVLAAVSMGSVAWGDYDNDGDLDILITGNSGGGINISKIYRNNLVTVNTKPSAPSGLAQDISGDSVVLSWNKATDTETPQDGLSYNLYIRSDSLYIKSPMSDNSSGYRKIVAMGNTNKTNSWTVRNLPVGNYYWSVQAIDNAFAGSGFAPEKTFTVLGIPSNVTISNETGYVTVTWDLLTGAKSYKIYASEDPYGTFTDVSNQGVFDGTSWSQIISASRLFYYVIAVTEDKNEDQKSGQVKK